MLQAYGIPVLEAQMAFNVDHAVSLAHHIGYPVALKIVSQKIVHKSDVGGVAMGLKCSDEVRAAAIRMRVDAARLAPHAPVQGQCLQENVVMAALARSAGFAVTTAPDGDTNFMRLALRPAAPAPTRIHDEQVPATACAG